MLSAILSLIRMRTVSLRALALVAYLWLCFSWFDHDFNIFLATTPAWIPALILLGVTAATWRPRFDSDDAIALGFAALALGLRLPFLWGAYGLFSSDASVQGLMALHILEGEHHPIFLYNWSYVGSLKAHLTALIAAIFGEPVVSFAAAAALIYALFTAAIYRLARTVVSRAEASVAAVYVIAAPGFLTAWGMGNEGNYVDVMLLGTLMLAIAARWMRGGGAGFSEAFWIGVLGGLAFWTHILATYYLLTVVGVLALHRFRRSGRDGLVRLATLAGGFVVGDFPGILWNASHEWLSFRWWSLDAETVEAVDRVGRTLTQLEKVGATSLSVLSGYWPREAPPWPAPFWHVALGLLIPAVFLFFAWRHRRALTSISPEAMLLGFAVLVVLVFAQSSFGWMTDEPRYLLFLFSVVPIFLGSAAIALWNRSRLLAGAALLSLLFVNVRGDVAYLQVALESDSVNRKFVGELEKLGIRHVRSDYHLSYKYVFLSHGRMVWTSELGPAQKEWYFPFRDQVAKAEDVALVPRSFRFARRIRRRLDARGIRYRQERLLYPVLYDFSEPVQLSFLR